MGTQRDKANLIATVTSVITTNGIGGVTGAILNTMLDDYSESLVFNNGTSVVKATWTSSLTGSSGTVRGITISPTVNQSGTAAYEGLRINATETAIGSGRQVLLSLELAAAKKFAFHSAGQLEMARMTAPGTPTANKGYLYIDTSDELLYYKNDTGTAYPLTGGDVTKVGTPVNNQLGIWTGDGTIEGESMLTYINNTGGSDVLSFGDGTVARYKTFKFDNNVTASSGSLFHALEFDAENGKNSAAIHIRGNAASSTHIDSRIELLASNGSVSPTIITTIDNSGLEINAGTLVLKSYVKATLPTAATGAVIRVSDETGGDTLAYYNGTNWKRMSDGATVS